MAIKHGIYIGEQATSISAPITGTAGLQVIIGTAPVNMLADPEAAVNKPIIAYTYKEAVAGVGYLDDFAHYTLCEAIKCNFQVVGVAPIILINVLDPKKHNKELKSTEVQINSGVAVLLQAGAIISELVVKNGEETLTVGEDFTTTFNNDGTLNIIVAATDKTKSATTLTVSGKLVDPDAVTEDDIVGGIDASTGKETGLEIIRQIYPKFQMTPGILVAPRWSKNAEVAAALQAKTKKINGNFGAACIVDIDSSASGATKYTDVAEQKTKQALTSENCYAVWLFGKLGDDIYSGSTLAAALTAYTDASNADTPNVSPSNKSIAISGTCLEDGTEVLLDQEQANVLNGAGVATFVNMNGFKLWGNYTVAYPSTTDVKDMFFAVKRFFIWTGNTFILTYSQKVDNPGNKVLTQSIVDSENIRGNEFVSRGICANYYIEFLDDENPVTDLLNGTFHFHQHLTPFPPAQDIENTLEYDPDALKAAFSM